MHLETKFCDSCNYFDPKISFFTSNKSIEDGLQPYATKIWTSSFVVLSALHLRNMDIFPYCLLARKNIRKTSMSWIHKMTPVWKFLIQKCVFIKLKRRRNWGHIVRDDIPTKIHGPYYCGFALYFSLYYRQYFII